MALREFTLQNLILWSTGGLLALGGTGLAAAYVLTGPEPTRTVAIALPLPVATPAALPVPEVEAPATPPREAVSALPRLHGPSPRNAASVRVKPVQRPGPATPREATRARLPPIPPAPGYAPPGYTPATQARWQHEYGAPPPPIVTYEYAPRYRYYARYPGY